MIRKVAPCTGCYITTMCVAPDDTTFYCNRCLPYFARSSMYPNQKSNVTESIGLSNTMVPKAPVVKANRKSTK